MEWKTIKKGTTWLLVSDWGAIIDYKTNKPVHLFDVDGYWYFKIRKFSPIAVHRIVLELFVEQSDPSKNTTNHINHIKKDNRASNLEWVTKEENLAAFSIFKNYSPDMMKLILDEERKRKHIEGMKKHLRNLMDKRITGYNFKYDPILCSYPKFA